MPLSPWLRMAVIEFASRPGEGKNGQQLHAFQGKTDKLHLLLFLYLWITGSPYLQARPRSLHSATSTPRNTILAWRNAEILPYSLPQVPFGENFLPFSFRMWEGRGSYPHLWLPAGDVDWMWLICASHHHGTWDWVSCPHSPPWAQSLGPGVLVMTCDEEIFLMELSHWGKCNLGLAPGVFASS
jgi:hypothetical protein